MTASRAIAFVVAVLVLLVSLSAEAKKKKKSAKKHKTPAAKVTKSNKAKGKGKSKESDRGLPPPESAPETDEASKEKEEKAPPSRKPAAEPAEGEEKGGEEKAPPPPAAEEEGAARPPARVVKSVRPAPEPEAEGGGGELTALSLGVGGLGLFRNLTWNQDNGALAPYTLSPGPEMSVWLEAFPAAFATAGFAGNIGLYGHFDYGLGASSMTPSGMKLTTKYQDFLAGLKIRIPFGNFVPYVTGAYGMQKFSLEPVMSNLPNFAYTFVSGGAGARIQFASRFDLDLGGAFLYALNPGSAAGEIGSNGFYPGATANGVDVSASIGVRVFGAIGIRAGGNFRQFGVATHYKTTDTAPRAGGATDRNIGVWGGVEVVFDGMGGGGGTEEPAPVKKAPPKAKKPPPREVEPGEDEGEGTKAGPGPDKEEGGGAGAGTDTDE